MAAAAALVDCGSTVILHSVSASPVSLLLLQNLLICKSIAYIYIFRSGRHLYFCAIYLPQRKGGEKTKGARKGERECNGL